MLDTGYGECLLGYEKIGSKSKLHSSNSMDQRYVLSTPPGGREPRPCLGCPLSWYELSDILHSWKSYTSNQINQRHNRAGASGKGKLRPIVRNAASLETFREYFAHPTEWKRLPAASSRQRQDAAATLCLADGSRLGRLINDLWVVSRKNKHGPRGRTGPPGDVAALDSLCGHPEPAFAESHAA